MIRTSKSAKGGYLADSFTVLELAFDCTGSGNIGHMRPGNLAAAEDDSVGNQPAPKASHRNHCSLLLQTVPVADSQIALLD